MTISNETASPAEAQSDKIINPWLAMWLKPRETIMHVVTTDPKQHVSLLAALSGIATTLSNASIGGFGDKYSIVSLLIMALILGSLGGLLRVAIEGWLLSWVGTWLGGESTSEEMRAASSWSYLPIIVPLTLIIPIFITVNLFGSTLGSILPLLNLFIIALIFMASAVAFLWRLFILASSIAALQNFNIGQAIANLLLAYGISLVFIFFIGICVVVLFI